jgi:hypothetical protein
MSIDKDVLMKEGNQGMEQVDLYESMIAQGKTALKNSELDRCLRRCDKALELAPFSREGTLLKIEALLSSKKYKDYVLLCEEILPSALLTGAAQSLITPRWIGADKGIDTQLILWYAKALLYSGDSNNAGTLRLFYPHEHCNFPYHFCSNYFLSVFLL